MAGSNKRITRSVNRFSEIPKAEIRRSTFNRSHGVKTTFDEGYLVPIFVDDVLPGDTYNLSMNGFARLATPLKPVMDNLYLDTFFFFVPNRLLWSNWQRFMGEQDNPGDSTDYVIPKLAGGTVWNGSDLGDYFGIPVGVDVAAQTSALPFRAYNRIYNEFFRAQDLQNSVPMLTGDGPDAATNYPILRSGKKHDYFTSCLPAPQKGPDVLLPLGDRAIVRTDANTAESISVLSNPTGAQQALTPAIEIPNVGDTVTIDTISYPSGRELYADLANATASSVNQLREAFQIQKLLERDARGGTRYTEIIKAHFNVTSPDARLQRPEYLGGGTTMIQINPVAQTTPSDIVAGVTPQGNLAAVGTGAWSGHGFTKSFTEHGFIIGLMRARCELTYQQGLERMWSRDTRYEHYFPVFQNLGEQGVLRQEIYADGTATDQEVFGYQERWAEYRYKPSKITGKFRSQVQPGDETDIDVWHYAEEYANHPQLGDAWIQQNSPVDRTIAVPTEPHFLSDMWFNLKCARPMPLYSVPGLIDHF